jgi:hypothetical protein
MKNYTFENEKISTAPLMTIPSGNIKNIKLSKGNEVRIEMSIENRITPISAGPAKSEGNGCASPIQMEGDSIELYNC